MNCVGAFGLAWLAALAAATPEPAAQATPSASPGAQEDAEAIRFKTTRIVVGLEYLGTGYDIVKAHTLGDYDQGEDLGYRAPVIEFTWAQTDVGVTNSLDSLQPVGGWVRPKVSCGEAENVGAPNGQVTEVDAISKLRELNEADVGVNVKAPNVGTAALNAQYEELKDKAEHTNNKLYANTYYCFTYAAGIPPTLDWWGSHTRRTTTDEFNQAVAELPKAIRHYEECTQEAYQKRKLACRDLLRWMEFFAEFGTHVVTEVHLGRRSQRAGGKLTRYLSVPSSMVEALTKQGLEVNAVVGAVISGVSGKLGLDVSKAEEAEIKRLKQASKLRFSVLGGIHPDKNISPQSVRRWKSTVPRYPMPIKVELTNVSTYLPKGYYNAFRDALNFYVALNRALPWDIEQRDGRAMTLKSLVLECREGYKVVTGFSIDLKDNRFTPCKTGERFCRLEKKGSMLLVCADARLPELTMVETASAVAANDNVNVGEGKYALNGFVACLRATPMAALCEPFATGCKLISKENCQLSIGWGMFST